jgi:membrane protein
MAEQKVSKNTRESPWKLGGIRVKELGKRVGGEFVQDDLLDVAAMLAYYFFFALFPMMIFLMALLGIVGGQGIGNNLIDQMTRMMPSSASTIVHETMKQALKSSDGAKLSFGVLITLWSAAAGITGLMAALNTVFEVRETRSFIKTKAIALGLTVGNSVIVIVGIVLLLYGGNIADHFLSGHLNIVWKALQYPLAIFFLLLAYSTIYYFAPNVEHPHWAWVTPGSVVGVVLWVIASVGLRIYLHFSNSYNATYGALGGVMILLLWFYVTGLAVLIGGEVNSEIEKAAGARQKDSPQRLAAERQVNSDRPAA